VKCRYSHSSPTQTCRTALTLANDQLDAQILNTLRTGDADLRF